jgi:hypothetical protein
MYKYTYIPMNSYLIILLLLKYCDCSLTTFYYVWQRRIIVPSLYLAGAYDTSPYDISPCIARASNPWWSAL